MNQLHEGYITALETAGSIEIRAANDPKELRSGRRSILFVDHAKLLTEVQLRNSYFEDLLNHLSTEQFSPDTTILCNVDSKSSPQTTAIIADRGGYRLIPLNPETTTTAEKGNGLQFRTPHDIESNDRIVIMDDVYTLQDVTAINVVNKLRELIGNGNEIHLFVGLIRGNSEECKKELEKSGIKLHYLITQNDLLRRAWRTLDTQQQDMLQAEFGPIE